MIKIEKKYSLTALGAVFLLGGILLSFYNGGGQSFIYFGIGTWTATLLYYTIIVKHPQVTAFFIGLIILHTGVLLILKDVIHYSNGFGFVTFVCGILVLLNSGFSEYMRKRK